jgi:hypothetical protein
MYTSKIMTHVSTTILIVSMSLMFAGAYYGEKEVKNAKHIDNEIATHFDKACTEVFYDQQKRMFIRSNWTKEKCTIETSKKWKQDGTWDECKRV